MNDIALSGLAKQLVLAELLTDQSAQQAYQQAQRHKISLVSYLVQNKLVKSRQVAEIASEHFGMALLDLNCLEKETQPKGLVSEKLVRQHHALPLWRRGNKLFVGVSDPTNHQAINDIQFSTGLNTEAILVEDDKLSDAIEKFFDSHSTGLEDMADVDLDGVAHWVTENNRHLTVLRMAKKNPTKILLLKKTDLEKKQGDNSLLSILNRLKALPNCKPSSEMFIRIAGVNDIGEPRNSWDWDAPFGSVVR